MHRRKYHQPGSYCRQAYMGYNHNHPVQGYSQFRISTCCSPRTLAIAACLLSPSRQMNGEGSSALCNRWQRLTVDLEGYPPGVRYAVVFFAGQFDDKPEGLYWGGLSSQGARFAAPEFSWKAPVPC